MFDPILTPPNRKLTHNGPCNHILGANIQEIMTHNVLPPMGVNVLGGKSVMKAKCSRVITVSVYSSSAATV